jgi:hypothetical protein
MRWPLLAVGSVVGVVVRVGSLSTGDGNAVGANVGADEGPTVSPAVGAVDTGIVVSPADGSSEGAVVGCEEE